MVEGMVMVMVMVMVMGIEMGVGTILKKSYKESFLSIAIEVQSYQAFLKTLDSDETLADCQLTSADFAK